jgi:hypothetical protein
MKQSDPEFEELFQKAIEAMPIEKRMAGLTIEQALGALPPDRVLDAIEVYLRTLPVEVQKRILNRLQVKNIAGDDTDEAEDFQ